MARDRAFRSNSFGISATIAFAFVMPNSRILGADLQNPDSIFFRKMNSLTPNLH
ncbi:hypothetical protein LEP1GSC021_0398 [Leptospira noguchii str. 1993005606]|uniref:Uncharacterized protein n=2 Tax=Leptospira noguchii TaxID=28182 RepID=M6YX40_9LEPT|nr:hypothetical protein LEP1GSC035_4611 [Leptospira noguchii str. 2007001578]EMO90923.1 hypothetical protein LEP1GSC024_0429 [Leptospira noguchii str. 2001034031]EPE84311.1 hypothetical protein LEP1GSC021_0398 [Leptospira noguchii str. 1993005606]